jgi:uncharacterized radical SAM superfamily Fe-S cluster-containing enzyme
MGGEPTTRDDLCEIIKIIVKAGHIPELVTNGLKLVDIDYLRKLKQCGLRKIWLWLETLKNDDIHEKIRGARLVAAKTKALDNLKELNMITTLFFVLVRNINEGEIGDVFNFVRENNFISRFAVEGYLNLGRRGFSEQEELTSDEVIEIVCRETKGFVTLEEFFLFQKLFYIGEVLLLNKPVCSASHYLIVPRGNNKKIREIFNLQKLERHLDMFSKIYIDSPFKAKTYFFKKILTMLIRNPGFSSAILKKIIYPDLQDNNYFKLQLIRVFTPDIYDLKQVSTRCVHGWLPSYNSGQLKSFCEIIREDAPL